MDYGLIAKVFRVFLECCYVIAYVAMWLLGSLECFYWFLRKDGREKGLALNPLVWKVQSGSVDGETFSKDYNIYPAIQKILVWNKVFYLWISITNKCRPFEISIHQIFLKIMQHKNTKQKTIAFNIANNQKCFLSSKSTYYNNFWRIMWHSRLE